MKKILSFWAMFLLITFCAKAQDTLVMNVAGHQTLSSCNAWIYDNGGPNGDYASNCNDTLVIYAGTPNSILQILGGTIAAEEGYDRLSIFDGVGTNGTRIAYYDTDSATVVPAVASSGAMTIVFHSDVSGNNSGFAIHIGCEAMAACGRPDALTLLESSATALAFTWNDYPGLGTPASYEVQYCQSGTAAWSSSFTTSNPMIILSNLNNNTLYDVKVRTVCDDASLSDWTEMDSVATLSCLAGVPKIIGTGSARNSYVPDYYYYNYSYSQQLFDSTEVHGQANINGLVLNIASASNATRNVDIYLGTTTLNTLPTTGISTTNHTLVYSGNITWHQGANTIYFTSPYNYNGGNLVVTMDDNTGSYQSAASFTGDTTRTSLYFYDDNTNVNPANVGVNLNVANFRNNVTFLTCNTTSNCSAPMVFLGPVTTTSVTLTWAPGLSESSWIVAYKPHASSAWTIAGTATVTSYTVSGLQPSSYYDFKVINICGTDTLFDQISAYTECGAISVLPYTQNFDASDDIPICWNTASTSSPNYPRVNDENALSESNSLYFNAYSEDGSLKYTYAALPMVDVLTNPINTLSLSFASNNDENYSIVVGVMSAPQNFNTFVPVDTITHTGSSSWNIDEVHFTQYSDTGAYICIAVETRGTENGAYIDNIVLQVASSCVRPSQPTLTATTLSSVSIQWTSVSPSAVYDVKYGPHGFNPDSSGTLMSAIPNNNTTINGLSAISYDFYVRTDCGDITSPWSYLPLTCTPGTYNMSSTGTTSVALCGGMVYDNGGSTGNYANNANSVLTINPDNSNSLVRITGTYETEEDYDVLYVYDGSSVYSPLLHSYSGDLDTIDITSSNGPLTLRFVSDGGFSRSGFAFAVSCVAAPTCRQPFQIAPYSLSSNAVGLNWSGYGVSDFQYIYDTNVINPTTTTLQPVAVTDTFVLLTNLQPATTYHFYVRTSCGSGEMSTWASTSFTTACNHIAIPYTHDFENDVDFPDCWTLINDATNQWYQGYPEIAVNDAHHGTQALDFLNSNSANSPVHELAVLPGFDAVANPIHSLQLEFYAKKSSNDNYGKMIVGVMTVPTDSRTFVPVDTLNFTENYREYIVHFDNYAGNGSFIALQAPLDQSLNISNSFFVDDITLRTIPACPRPTNVNAVTGVDSVQLSWSETGEATQWEIVYGGVGFNPNTAGTTLTVNDNPYTILNLTSGTVYDFYVRALCSATDTSNWTDVLSTATLGGISVPVSGTDTVTACGGWIFDDGGFLGNCSENSDGYLIIYPDNNQYVRIQGTVSVGEDYSDDEYLDIYDGDNLNAPIIGHLYGSNIELDTVSTVGPLMLHIYTEEFGENPGFALQISCVSGASCSRPYGILVNNISSTGADVSWTGNATTTASYTVSYGPEGYTPGSAAGTDLNATAASLSLTNLTANTTYDVYVRGNCNGGDQTDYSPVATFTTYPCDNGCAYTINMTDEYGDGWNGGTITLAYSTDPTHTSAVTLEDGETGNATAIACGGVASFTWTPGDYDEEVSFTISDASGSVIFTCADGSTLVANAAFFTDTCSTVVIDCPTPTNFHLADTSSTTATLAWNQETGTATAWTLQYKQVAAANWSSVDVTTNPYLLTNLTANTSYMAQIRANCSDGSFSSYTTPITFTTSSVGVEDYTLANQVKLYPNPASEYVEININNMTASQVAVYDIYGKLLNTIKMQGNTARLDIHDFADGMYFVRVLSDKGIVTKKFIKK